jgi:hypothetical protein
LGDFHALLTKRRGFMAALVAFDLLRSGKSAPRRLQIFTRSPCFQAKMRKPSCFTSCSHPVPAGGRSMSVGSHGRMNPDGSFVANRGAGARHITVFGIAPPTPFRKPAGGFRVLSAVHSPANV